MKTQDFYYDLPKELIAQTPADPRDSSRLLVVHRDTHTLEHRHFYNILDYLTPGDTLILNDTRVLPARLYGEKLDTGAHVEFLMLNQKENDVWEVMTGPGRRAKLGARFAFGDGLMEAEILEILDNGNRLARFTYDGDSIFSVLEKIGEMPLPHYITKKLEDGERYQTVYAKEPGSAAAPTAGLHFTKPLLQKIREKGVNIGFVTLHVGIGTFRPVKAENIEDHKMHAEHYHVSEETAQLIRQTKTAGKRVIAVGTTACRTLESVATLHGEICAADEWTSIFIYPGYTFKCIDALLTNFHLPESTLIMLISAFYDREHVLGAYKTAVEEKYRFFSFGDAMLLL